MVRSRVTGRAHLLLRGGTASFPYTIAHPRTPQILTSNAGRTFHASSANLDVPSWPPPPLSQLTQGPDDQSRSSSGYSNRQSGQENSDSIWKQWASSSSFQAALTTIVGLGMVFGAGVGYLEWYKHHVLHRIMRAFEPGYDPALELSTLHAPSSSHILRREQALIDRIVRGEEAGGYYLMIGPKGTGKGTMILDAMRAINAEGASVVEAHPDLEVFRLRLGKALDFDFYEDWQGSLFSRADPRNGGPALDVERAMTKLEKAALRYARKNGRPLVLAFNNIHLFPNTPEGHALLHQLQQRAEAWAEGGIMTMIFSTDDFWCLDKMKKNASRMRILSVYDLSAQESIRALRHLRHQALLSRSHKLHHLSNSETGLEKPMEDIRIESDEVLRQVYQLIGGRTSYLARAARAGDMLEEARDMIESEKAWLLSKIGLIPEMDDDVMDEQKWASCSWLLLRHLAQNASPLPKSLLPLASASATIQEEPEIPAEMDISPSVLLDEDDYETTSPAPDNVNVDGEVMLRALNDDAELLEDVHSPKVSFELARRLMTRADFLEGLDHANIISVDVHHDVRADSVLLLRAAQLVVADEGFDEALDQTRARVDEIEGLHRQSELTVKEPFRVLFGRSGGKTTIDVIGLGGSFVPASEDVQSIDADAEEDGETRRLI